MPSWAANPPKPRGWDTSKQPKESEMRLDFLTMAESALKKAYNELVIEATGLGLTAAAVRRFKSKDIGIQSCEALYKSICEAKGETYEPPAELSADADDEFEVTVEHPKNDVDISSLKTSKEAAPPAPPTPKKPIKKPAKKTGKKVVKKVAKKVAKKTVAKTPAKTPKKAAVKKDQLPISAALGLRTNSLLEKIAVFLSAEARIGKMIVKDVISKHLYGDVRAFNRVDVLIKVMKKDQYDLKKEVKNGVTSYGLYAKK